MGNRAEEDTASGGRVQWQNICRARAMPCVHPSTAKNKTSMQGSTSKYPEKSLDSTRREGSRLRGKCSHDGWGKGQEHTTETLSQGLPHRPQGKCMVSYMVAGMGGQF